jgi:FMN phosphatase YigB (HAD superfamily)
LSVIVDSRRVGLYKPDPAIYVHAVARLGFQPSSVMMVGDSFDRDVLPARSIGMKTAWLQGPFERACPDLSALDVCLRALTDLPAALEAQERTFA